MITLLNTIQIVFIVVAAVVAVALFVIFIAVPLYKYNKKKPYPVQLFWNFSPKPGQKNIKAAKGLKSDSRIL